jgi:predicted transcriptional regulator
VVQATGRSRNALIRQAIEDWLERQEHRRWPEEVLAFQGIPEAVPSEQARAELLPAGTYIAFASALYLGGARN